MLGGSRFLCWATVVPALILLAARGGGRTRTCVCPRHDAFLARVGGHDRRKRHAAFYLTMRNATAWP
jgi:hypothetical protein